MKRITYLFFLFFLLYYSNQLHSQEISFYYDKIVGSLSYQSDGGQLIENLTRQIWDETSSSWVNDSLYEHFYNDKNLVDTIFSHKWGSGFNWNYVLRSTYSYNTNSKLIRKSFANYGGGWNEYAKHEYSYSGVNQNLSRISFYGFSSNTWVLYGYDEYSWNTNNFLVNVITYTLSTIFPWTYFATGKDEYYYDSTNVLIMKTELYSFYGYVWINYINDLYFYDQNGNNNERIRQDWNSTDSIWVNDYRYLYEYDIDNVLLSIVYQDWQQDSSDWENAWRETYTYTPQNKIATMLKETWTQGIGWNNYVFRTYFYDNNYNWTEKLTQLWDGTNWDNYYRHLATWMEPVSVEEEQLILNSYYLFNNYPNPFNPTTKIKFTIPSVETTRRVVFTTLVVYDILGREIATLVNEEKPSGTYEVEFNSHSGEVRNLPAGRQGLTSGIYFYTLRAGAFSETKKMILLK